MQRIDILKHSHCDIRDPFDYLMLILGLFKPRSEDFIEQITFSEFSFYILLAMKAN